MVSTAAADPDRAGGAEPLALIGIGCRFAGGAGSPDSFWELLRSGRDGIGEVPADRWRGYGDRGPDFEVALRRATRWGGFLADIEGFDAEFFGLTPREAELMDPQQRILLETAWEALEHAGIPPRELAGTETGVFVGVGSDDYGRRLLEDLPRIEAWTGIGAALCAVANRVSYALDLRGASLAVDTACSASLVAVHLAAQSLRLGESRIALAGGVNLIVAPGLTLTLDAAGATAPDGRSKSFSAAADGYGRGEGAGVIVLKRLSDARADGDRVLAVLRGSAVNQDGRTNGIMAPSAEAQQHVIERACRLAGVDPATVDYVEAHGTGTRLGDPLEAAALSAVYGAGRPAGRPCRIGSVKSNIGHLEAGAGVAGIIKAVLALGAEEIPPSLHCEVANPAVDWAGSGLEVVTAATPWPRGGSPRRAGVSAFGYGGTIAHVVLEEAPDPAVRPAAPAPSGAPRLYPLSAASPQALRAYAGELAGWLGDRGRDVPVESVGHTLAHRRSHLQHRAAVVAAGGDELVTGLRRLADGEDGDGVVTGTLPAEPGAGLVWVFSGHGAQWTGMARELLATEPVFGATLDSLETIFRDEIGFAPREVIEAGEHTEVARVQTMIFAVQLGLAEVWRSRGVTPAAVIGHSVGEIAAAVSCGALSPEDGARLSCRRSLLLRRVVGRGAMAMVELPFEEAAGRLAGQAGVVAAIQSSPVSTVVSGDAAALAEVAGRWRAEGLVVRDVASDVAFHSPHMDPLLAELAAAAGTLSPAPPRIPMYSTALPDPYARPAFDGAYWAANLRNPVRLAAAVRAARADGHRGFLEVSTHPVVAHSVEQTLLEHDDDGTVVAASLRRNRPERATLLAAAGTLHCAGVPLDWAALQPAGELVTLPPVAWQRRRHWREAPAGTGEQRRHDVDAHSLLGTAVPVGGRSLRLWRTLLSDETRPYPGSHTIDGVEIVPAAVLLGTLLAAAAGDGDPLPVLGGVSLLVPLRTADRREVQVLRDDRGLQLLSRSVDEPPAAWLTHTTATVLAGPRSELPARLPEPDGRAEPADAGLVRQRLAAVGVPTMAFEWTVPELTRGPTGLRARVRAPHGPVPTWGPLLDAVLSVAPAAYPGEAVLRMVAHVEEVHLTGTPPAEALVDVRTDPVRGDAVEVLVADAAGTVLARLSGLRYAAPGSGRREAAEPGRLVHQVAWRPLAPPEPAGPVRRAIVVAADPAPAGALRDVLTRAGVECELVREPAGITGAADAGTDVLLIPPAAEGGGVPAAAAAAAWQLAGTVQLLSTVDPAAAPRVWCLTAGAREAVAETGLAQAAAWGLGRVVATEHPHLWGGVIDLPAEGPDGCAETLPAVLRSGVREDVLALRGGTVEVARLAPPAAEPPRAPVQCRPEGTYLVTGGLGVLGLEVARWLAGRGARRIVLAGRSPVPARTGWDDPTADPTADPARRHRLDRIRELEALGVTVRTVAVDVADADAAARALSEDALGLPPIRGVVHAAGVLDSRLLAGLDEESLRTVLRPKVEGGWVLHRLFPPGRLDFLVFFSSCGYLLGLPGQASYGAANAVLDALARHRLAAGGTETMSLGWTSWRGQGMADNEIVDMELRARGVTDISTTEAFGAWDAAAALGGGHHVVLGTVPPEPGAARPALLAELDTGSAAAVPADPDPGGLAAMGPQELREHLLGEVSEAIATEMRLPAQHLDARRSLAEQGLDSVMTLVIRRRLEKRFGQSLPTTLLWHQPTVTAIAEHLAGVLSTPAADPAAPEPVPAVDG